MYRCMYYDNKIDSYNLHPEFVPKYKQYAQILLVELKK